MPFIFLQTNVKIDEIQAERLKAGLGKAIERVPGKSEQVLMVGLEGEKCLYLKGKNTPAAHIKVAVFGNRTHQGYAELSHAITALVHAELGISPTQIYVQYEDIPAWSVGGYFFEEGR